MWIPVSLTYSDVGAAAAAHNHSGVYSPVSHNHSGTYAPVSHEHAFSTITSKPTTLSGYGITDAASDTELLNHKNDIGPEAHLPKGGLSGQFVNHLGQMATVTWANIGSKGTVATATHSWIDPMSGDIVTLAVSGGLVTSFTKVGQ
jgi:hypothetical protein